MSSSVLETNQPAIKVAVPRPLHGTYDYRAPADMPAPQPGCRVRVPFGRSEIIGIVIDNQCESSYPKLKAISEQVDTQPLLDDHLLALAQWMADYYHHPLGEVLSTMLPAAARKGAPDAITAADIWQVSALEFTNSRAPTQQKLWQYLHEHGPQSGSTLVEAGFKRATLRTLRDTGYVEQTDAPLPAALSPPLAANEEQQRAIDQVLQARDRYAAFLLEGVTGSGKTEVYLQCIQAIVDAGAQALVLVPEIALTPQTVNRFRARFAQVGSLHSGLTDNERMQTWLKCRAGQIKVLIGTRSALLAPFEKLGLIVVDEEHDGSYKQQDGLRYSARDLAAKRAHLLNIPLLLGSATPALETLHNVNQGRYSRLALRQRATGASMPSYHLLDMRGQTHQDGISNPLIHVIRRHLESRGQVLLFLNRRGYSPSLLCSACGWQAHCSDCDARLTLHQKPPQLVCHYCSLRFEIPDHCGECGQKALLPVGLGTQRTESGLAKLFPGTTIHRIDRDSVRTSAQLDQRFAAINSGEPCIMVGTQMLAKGHHFPNVTLVAIINADAGFASPDFRAPERTAQLIVQVAGRAGRAERAGEVFIQTYQPEHPQLQRLVNEGYEAFAQNELSQRIAAGMPPAQPMAMIRADAHAADTAIAFLNACKTQLNQASDRPTLMWGPVAAPTARIANRLRYQLMLLGESRRQLHHTLKHLNLEPPSNLRWSIDIDPYDTL